MVVESVDLILKPFGCGGSPSFINLGNLSFLIKVWNE
jgi:hypothetical protein